jgi:hypothetical protein
VSTDDAGFESSVDADSVSDDVFDDEVSAADGESAEESATATQGVVATAVPMPSATASAPDAADVFRVTHRGPSPIRERPVAYSRCDCQRN